MSVAAQCLARNTVLRGQLISGLVIVQRAKQIKLSVQTPGESHQFTFDVK